MGSCFLKNGQYEEFTDFYLLGHSFGGYLTGNYSLKYHQHIKKLILCSPIGIKVQQAHEKATDPMDRFEDRKGTPNIVRHITYYAWDNKISPFDVSRFFGKALTLKLLHGYVANKQKVDKLE